MEALSLQNRKLNVIEYLAVMQDEKLFSQIEVLINKSKKNTFASINKMTKGELITRTTQAEADIQNKRLISQSDLEKESQSW